MDRAANLLRVHASNHGAVVEEQTKTEAGERVVPLFPSARKVLAAREFRATFKQPDDFVFCTIVGTPVDPNNFVKRDFRSALERAGLGQWIQEGRSRRRWEGAVTWHSLRHYAVSTLIAQRADIKLLQAIAGHASATMTLDVYGHLMTERASEAADLYDPLSEATGRSVVDAAG